MTYKQSEYIRNFIGHFTDFAVLKRMKMFNTAKVILEKSVNISRKEILSNLSELLLESCIKKHYL